jgi:hypothetical protein
MDVLTALLHFMMTVNAVMSTEAGANPIRVLPTPVLTHELHVELLGTNEMHHVAKQWESTS